MNAEQEQALNEAAFRRLEQHIAQTYPAGQFVAISGGQIVADAQDFDELSVRLIALGKEPSETFIVQAGVHYPESAIIFLLPEMGR